MHQIQRIIHMYEADEMTYEEAMESILSVAQDYITEGNQNET